MHPINSPNAIPSSSPRHPRPHLALSVCAALGATLPLAQAEESAEPEAPGAPEASPWWDGATLTGNWGGARDQAAAKGFSLNAAYTGDVMANVSGGMRTGAAYLHLFQLGLDWEPEPLIGGWPGARFRASGIYPFFTRGLTLDLVGDLNGADNIEAPNDPRLYEVWYLQRLWEGRFSFQVGSMLADADFAYNDLATVFVNAGFGWSQFMAANTGTLAPAYPFAALGLRLEWHPTRRTCLQLAAYDGDALDNAAGDLNDNPDGFGFELTRDQGVFAVAEFAYRRNQLEGDTGLPGTYKLGGFYQSSTFDDLYYDANGGSWVVTGSDPRTYAGNAMLYVAGQQQLWREPTDPTGDQGLGAFFRLGAGPSDRNPVPLVIDGGFSYQGLIPGRERDSLAFGVVYAGLSEELQRQEQDDRDLNGADITSLSDYEVVFELTYQAQLNDWWTLQPDVQCIVHPGRSDAYPTAWVLGLRTTLVF